MDLSSMKEAKELEVYTYIITVLNTDKIIFIFVREPRTNQIVNNEDVELVIRYMNN